MTAKSKFKALLRKKYMKKQRVIDPEKLMMKPLHIRQQILKELENETLMKERVEHIDKMYHLRDLHYIAK